MEFIPRIKMNDHIIYIILNTSITCMKLIQLIILTLHLTKTLFKPG